jgi:hypothetical protein
LQHKLQLEATIYCRSDSGGLQRMCVTLNSDGFELAAPAQNGNSNNTDAVEGGSSTNTTGRTVAASTTAVKSEEDSDNGVVSEAPHSAAAAEEFYNPDAVRTPRPGTWQGTLIRGRLTGKSAGLKRPTFSGSGARSGTQSCDR